MCGRYTLTTPAGILAKAFQMELIPDLSPRYNVAPTQEVPVIRAQKLEEQDDAGNPARDFSLMHWGLIPFFSKDRSGAARMINARGESAAEKPAFRRPFRLRRCLVLSDGFIEWKTIEKLKHPYFIRFQDERPFAYAGLWDGWMSPEGQRVDSVTILTTQPNEVVKPYHDRMPVILEPESYDLWLDKKVQEPEKVNHLLVPFPASLMKAEAINRRVNNVRNDDAECLTVVPEYRQEKLF